MGVGLQICSPLVTDMLGARALIAAYVPCVDCTAAASRAHVTTKRRRYGKRCSMRFGTRVDEWLTSFVDRGWLDFEYECDREFKKLLIGGDVAATAAHLIREALVGAGFVAIESQLKVEAYGLGPVLDLLGFDAQGTLTLVEVKCGVSATDRRQNGKMLPPLEAIAYTGENMAFMQLAVQLACVRETPGLSAILGCNTTKQPTQAWLLSYTAPMPDTNETGIVRIRSLPEVIASAVESLCRNYQLDAQETI